MKETAHFLASTKGRLTELLRLVLPLLGVAFANYVFLLVEKIYLARLSSESMEAAVNIAYVCQIFQGSTMALAMMAQVFVGRWHGAKEFGMIGPGIWQFIWFSFLSMFITVPATLLYGQWYFHGTAIEKMALPYFYLIVGTNFLYPLGVAFSSFYLGQGKTRLVLLGSLASQAVKIVLGYFLIFGWETVIPSFGLIGGAISTIVAQGGFCLLLGINFLNAKYAQLFESRNWGFKYPLFRECIHPGLLRAMNRVSNFLCWASIAHLMVARGGDYLLVLSIGGSFFLFLPFLNEALCQAQTTIVSQLIGSKKYFLLFETFRSGMILVVGIIILMSIPCILIPTETLNFLFPHMALTGGVQQIFFGIWMSFAFFTLNSIPLSYILAFKDMTFSFCIGLMNWVNGYLLMYAAIEKFHIAANAFWLILSLMHATTLIAYLWRMKVLCRNQQRNYIAVEVS